MKIRCLISHAEVFSKRSCFLHLPLLGPVRTRRCLFNNLYKSDNKSTIVSVTPIDLALATVVLTGLHSWLHMSVHISLEKMDTWWLQPRTKLAHNFTPPLKQEWNQNNPFPLIKMPYKWQKYISRSTSDEYWLSHLSTNGRPCSSKLAKGEGSRHLLQVLLQVGWQEHQEGYWFILWWFVMWFDGFNLIVAGAIGSWQYSCECCVCCVARCHLLHESYRWNEELGQN